MALSAALLEGEELLGAEGLVVDLRRGLDQILEMGPEKEVPEVDEFAVVLILHVDNAPPILAAAHLLAIDDDGLLGSDEQRRGSGSVLKLVHKSQFWSRGKAEDGP